MNEDKFELGLVQRELELAIELRADSRKHLRRCKVPETKRWYKNDLKEREADIKRFRLKIKKLENRIKLSKKK